MRMFHRHVSHQLAAHLDGELTSSEEQRFELHLAGCASCRGEYEQVRRGIEMLGELPVTAAPDDIWRAIEAAIPRHVPLEPHQPRSRLALAALAVGVLAVAGYFVETHRSSTIEARQPRVFAQIKAGQWIETDSSSSATVTIGKIGLVEVGPGTRLLVLKARPEEHRLALVRGEIHAKISAPPKLFFVDTAAGTAVDLGCEYSLHTDQHGTGLLHVTMGWVAFQWKGVESLVPAGASCQTRPQAGPGVPYFDDAPESFKQALESFTVETAASKSMDVILSEARVRDTLTLWHLLFRVGPQDRERIYERMAELTPVPAGVARDQVMTLDKDTLARWKDELAWTW